MLVGYVRNGLFVSDSKKTSTLSWMRNTLLGHVVLYEILVAPPLAFVFIARNYHDGTLTTSWALFIVVVSIVAALFLAVTSFFLLTAPVKKKFGGEL